MVPAGGGRRGGGAPPEKARIVRDQTANATVRGHGSTQARGWDPTRGSEGEKRCGDRGGTLRFGLVGCPVLGSGNPALWPQRLGRLEVPRVGLR